MHVKFDCILHLSMHSVHTIFVLQGGNAMHVYTLSLSLRNTQYRVNIICGYVHVTFGPCVIVNSFCLRNLYNVHVFCV